MDKQPTLMELLVTMNKVKEFTKCDGEKTLAELFNLLMDEITTLRQQLAEQPNVDVLVETLERLINTSNDADGFGYGTLSTTFVRYIATQALSTYQSKNEKE